MRCCSSKLPACGYHAPHIRIRIRIRGSGSGSGSGSGRIHIRGRNRNRKQGCLLLQRHHPRDRAYRVTGGRAVFDIVPRATRPPLRDSQCLRGQSPNPALKSWAPARRKVVARPISVVTALPVALADHADRATLGGTAVRWSRSRKPAHRAASVAVPVPVPVPDGP